MNIQTWKPALVEPQNNIKALKKGHFASLDMKNDNPVVNEPGGMCSRYSSLIFSFSSSQYRTSAEKERRTETRGDNEYFLNKPQAHGPTEHLSELREVYEVVSVLVQQCEGALGDSVGVRATDPRRQQLIQALELSSIHEVALSAAARRRKNGAGAAHAVTPVQTDEVLCLNDTPLIIYNHLLFNHLLIK